MTRRYYKVLCSYEILQKYFQGSIRTRISGSLCASGNGFSFADVLLGRCHVSGSAWRGAGDSGKSGRLTISNVEWELHFESSPQCSFCDSQTQLRILHGDFFVFESRLAFCFVFCLRSKPTPLPRQVRIPEFPFQFWGWSWVKTCLWPEIAPCVNHRYCGITSVLAKWSH